MLCYLLDTNGFYLENSYLKRKKLHEQIVVYT